MVESLKNSVTNISFLFGLSISLVCLLFGKIDFSLGIMLGTLTSILSFRLLARNIEGIVKSKTGASGFKAMGGYLFRMIIMAAVLWFAINKSIICFIGAAIGLFATRMAVYINALLEKKHAKTG